MAVTALAAVTHAAAGGDAVLEVHLANRQVADGKTTHRVDEGDDVVLRWHSDEDVELHLHGYGIAIQVPAGGSASMAFSANASGRFPITHHGFGEQMGRAHGERPVLYLEVYPE